MQVAHYSGYSLTQAGLLLVLSLYCITASYNISGRLRGQCCEGERRLRFKWRRFYFGKCVLVSIHLSQQLWLWFEGGQIQPLNLTGDVEKCCRCISWMHGENFWWLNRRWRILWAWVRSWFCLCDWGFEQGICNTVNPMSFESTSWDPRNHEADFKTLLCRKKYIFFPCFLLF